MTNAAPLHTPNRRLDEPDAALLLAPQEMAR